MTAQPRIITGPEGVALGVGALRAGDLAAFPTETVYGLGADALDARAVARVFTLKGRPAANPLIVHVSCPDMARRVVADWTPDADRLGGAFWPGPLTLVLPKGPDIPGLVTASGPAVGVRCPDHPVALALIEAFGGPIVGPSANPSGRVSPTTAEHVRAGFPGVGLLILDGGPCRGGIESTVLDLTGEPARILRPGIIGADAIAGVLGRFVRPAGDSVPLDHTGSPAASPGLLGPHYQPRTPLRVTRDLSKEKPDDSVVLISWSARSHPAGGVLLAIPPDPGGFAALLYALLHQADGSGAGLILVELPVRPDHAGGAAVHDALLERLGRASKPP